MYITSALQPVRPALWSWYHILSYLCNKIAVLFERCQIPVLLAGKSPKVVRRAYLVRDF
jgi:hypothetical protein